MHVIYLAYDNTVSKQRLAEIHGQATAQADVVITARELTSKDEHTADSQASLLIRASELWIAGEPNNMQVETRLNQGNRLMGPRPVKYFKGDINP